MTTHYDDITVFEQARPGLFGLAYRLLGSRADAEDAVQETFLKWRSTDRALIDSPGAWLTTACTRHCLDLLRNAHHSRLQYVGTWLPEPVQIDEQNEPQSGAELASSLTTAFLLLLERLTPKERAAYLLHDIFDMDYPDIALILELQEPACRKLVSRARQHVERGRVRHATPPEQQSQLLLAFEQAVQHGRTDALARLLSTDVRLAADGGGKVSAARRVMVGSDEVLKFITSGLHVWWAGLTLERATINGTLGLIVRDGDGQVSASASFAYDEHGCLDGIYIMRNPDKLARIDQAVWPIH